MASGHCRFDVTGVIGLGTMFGGSTLSPSFGAAATNLAVGVRTMRCIWHAFFVVLVLHGIDAPAQQPVDDSRTPRQVLRDYSWVYNWPGGALFHTAFHRGYTTRFLLLKKCASSPVIADYLELTENQLKSVRELKPVVSSEIKNAQPDEQAVDADYYAFLSKEQLLKLDITALRFDGFWALTRQSLAGSARLSADSKSNVAAVVAEVRDRIIMPKFRWALVARRHTTKIGPNRLSRAIKMEPQMNTDKHR